MRVVIYWNQDMTSHLMWVYTDVDPVRHNELGNDSNTATYQITKRKSRQGSIRYERLLIRTKLDTNHQRITPNQDEATIRYTESGRSYYSASTTNTDQNNTTRSKAQGNNRDQKSR